VDEAASVGVVQRLGCGSNERRHRDVGQPGLGRVFDEIATRDELGDEVAKAVLGPADVVDGDDAGVIEAGRTGRCLAGKRCGASGAP
jgi:hypothetical protein